MKKADFWLCGGLLLAAAVLFFIFFFQSPGNVAVVTVDKAEFGRYALDKDQTVEIGGGNRLVISGGAAKMEWAGCPDQICVNHAPILRPGESIICLPNRVVVEIQ